jgi:proline racemase
LSDAGALGDDEWPTHDSIIGSRFLARAVEHVDGGVVPEVR